jgi:DNA-binding NarL/FixJ family response regulator
VKSDLKIAIIEDEKSIRDNIALLLESHKGFEVIGMFATGEDAIINIPLINPDVVLVDINLPNMSGIDCIKELKPICSNTQFLVSTSFEDTETVFNALKAGATGYLTKTIQSEKLLKSIVEVTNGGSPMSSHIARKVVDFFSFVKPGKDIEKLTERELQILKLLSQGLRYKEIAETTFISTETVRKHINNIYRKLQVQSSIEAINKVFPR